jgi:hypothetical protein
MTDTPAEPDDQDSLTPQQKLAALVASRKAAARGDTWSGARGDRRSAERNAAARSASRSKPAMRK